MKKFYPCPGKNRFLVLLLWLCIHQLQAQTKDAALWTGIELEKKLGNGFSGHAKWQFRLNENFTHADYTFLDLGFNYSAGDHVEFATAYCFNWKNKVSAGNDWVLRGQWYANMTLSGKMDDFKFSNRSQLQTDIEDARNSAGSWFYRNKTTLQYKLGGGWAIYGSVELYFRLSKIPEDEGYIYRKRYAGGFKYRISKRNTLEAGYLVQNQVRRSQPDYIYAITLGYSRTFKK